MIQDPVSVVDLVAQSASDIVEEEGFAYLTGGALTALIPTSSDETSKGRFEDKGTGEIEGE